MWVGLLFVAMACSGEPSGSKEDPGRKPAESAARRPDFDKGTGLIRTGDRLIRLDLEIADSPAERAFGLMHRRSLDDRAGMMFLFEASSTGGFYMKDTLIPLSIAFMDGRGAILRILDMDPCIEEPCKVYYPNVAYKRALEVKQGAFEGWGVTEGDVVELHR